MNIAKILKCSVALLLFFLIRTQNCQAQLLVDTTLTAQQLAQTLVGNGVTISNVSMTCPNGAHGGFTATGTNLGMSSGIILASGRVKDAPGPNSSTSTSTSFNANGDPDLDTIVNPDASHDACILEFDVFVKYDTLVFNYVFGSEEYEEFVNSFNDVFALFISGPGIVGKKNIAIIPGTASPTSINNVNCAVNSAYYTCNDANSIGTNSCTNAQCPAANSSTTLEYDGFTHVLQAKSPVIRCNTYHIKLAVADVIDWVYDSGIFIEAGSLSSIGITVSAATVNGNNYPNAVEGCLNGQFQFRRKTLLNQPLTLHFNIGGTATFGSDYSPFADSVVFNVGDTLKTINLIPLQDNINEPNETVTLIITDSSCSSIWADTVSIVIQDRLKVNAGNDTTVCQNPVHLAATASGFLPTGTNYQYAWSPLANIISGANTATPSCHVSMGLNTFVVQLNSIPSCPETDTVKVILSLPFSLTVGGDTTVCPNTPVTIWASGANSYIWSSLHGNTIVCNTCSSTSCTIANSSDSFIVKGTGLLGCSILDTVKITMLTLPISNFTVSPNSICNGDSVNILFTGSISSANAATPVYHWNWAGGNGRAVNSNQDYRYIWVNNSHTDSIKNISLSISQGNCVGNTYQQNVIIHPIPKAKIILPDSICSGNAYSANGLLSQVNTHGGAVHYHWNWNGAAQIYANADSSKDSIKTIIFTNTSQAQKIYLRITQDGCSSPLDSNSLIINPIPVASFIASPDTICPNGITTFKFNGTINPAGGAVSSAWNFNNGIANPGFGLGNQHVIYANGGSTALIYNPTLSITQNGCKSLPFSLPVMVMNHPKAEIKGINIICQGQHTLFYATPQGLKKYLWSNNATTDSIIVSAPGYYYVQVENFAGCWDTTSMHLIVNPKPVAVADSAQSIYMGNSVTIYGDNSSGGDVYSWNPAYSLNNPNSSQPIATPSNSTNYQLIYTNSVTGCVDTAYVLIDVNPCSPLRLPNAFTPQGDGKDDYYMIMNPNDVYQIIAFEIFDRWGNKVFATDDKNSKGWDGEYNGKPAPIGTYMYRLTSKCGGNNSITNQKGDLILLR